MIRSLSSSVDSAVGIYAFKTAVGSFKSLTITMMFSEFWNSCSMYCFNFFLNFLYLYLDYLCLDVIPKTAPTFSTSTLKLLIDDVYTWWLKRMPCL